MLEVPLELVEKTVQLVEVPTEVVMQSRPEPSADKEKERV